MFHPLIARRDAAQATLDAFLGKPLDWRTAHCAMVAALNVRRLGYAPPPAAERGYRNATAARRAFLRAGYPSLPAAIDALGLPRTGFASTLPGDLVGLESGEDWPALGVVVDPGLVLAFSAHFGVAAVAKVNVADLRADDLGPCVWRVEPCLTR